MRAPVFDDLSWFRPFVQTYTSEKLAWVDVPAAHSFPAFSHSRKCRNGES